MYKIMVQLGLTYGVALGRAVVSALFFNAWRATSAATSAGGTVAGTGATVPVAEAAKILNVSENATAEEVNQAFERMYDANSPEKGNSFYLQSKVFRARESLLAHIRNTDNDADLDPPPGPDVAGKQ